MKHLPLMALLTTMAFPGIGATTYYVATNGIAGATGTAEDPFPTIQDGLSAAAAKDTVVVADGLYLISAPLTCEVNITLKSASGNRDKVVIDAQKQCACLSFPNAKATCRISGMTFRNGRTTNIASVSLVGTACVVSNVHITACSCTTTGNVKGGGLALSGQDAVLCDSVVDDCSLIDGQPMATAAVLQLRGGGVAMGANTTVSRTVVSNCSIRAYCDQNNYVQVGGGIFGYSTVVEDCVVTACSVSNTANTVDRPGTKRRGGFGGGLSLHRYSALHNPCVVRNCLIADNEASFQSAGAHVEGDDSLVENCKFIGNVLRPLQATYSGAGSALCLTGAGTTLRYCQVLTNTIAGAVGSSGGGAIACLSGVMTGALLHDNLFEGNAGGVASVLTCLASGVTVSNCVIRGNGPQTGLDGAVVYAYNANDLMFADCWLTDNEASGVGGVLNGYQAATQTGAFGVKFRNCLLTRNDFVTSSAASALLHWRLTDANYDNRLVLENSTIVGNMTSCQSGAAIAGYKAAYGGGDIYCDGCVVVGNGQGGTLNFKNSTSLEVGHICRTYTTGNVSTDPADENVIGTDPGFADAANGDYRPADKSSALVDKVPAAGTWRDGRKVLDLGDGTCTIANNGSDYGITVTRNNPVRRWSGKAADIGCFEFNQPPGLMLLLK